MVTYGLIDDNTIERLTTDRMRKNNWLTLHQRAWSKVKAHLKLPPTIEEADLDDTTELTVATVYMVLYLAYEQAAPVGGGMREQSGLYYRKAIKTMAEVRLTSGGVELPRRSYQFRRGARA